MSVGDIETADDVGARTQTPIEAFADIDNSCESERTDHTQFRRTHRQQRLTGREVKVEETHE